MKEQTLPVGGGSYIVENGARRRVVDPTVPHPDGNCAREADGSPVGAAAPAPAAEPAPQAQKKGAAK